MSKIKKAYIEITNACNLVCAFCPGTSRPEAFMAEAGFRAALEQLRGRAQCLYFHVMGEPLLHPRLGAFLDMAHEAGFPVNLATNGTLLGRAGEGLIGKPALRQVHISLHSRSALGASSGYMDEVIRFVKALRGNSGALVAFRLWNGEDGSTRAISERLAREFGPGHVPQAEEGDNRGVRLAPGVYLNRSAPFEWPSLGREEIGSKGFCMGLRDQIGILCDGTVVPCCVDGEGALALGNISGQALDEILGSPRARALREGFTRREAVESLCRRCGFHRRFG